MTLLWTHRNGMGLRETGAGWAPQRLGVGLGQVERQFPESSNQGKGSDVIGPHCDIYPHTRKGARIAQKGSEGDKSPAAIKVEICNGKIRKFPKHLETKPHILKSLDQKGSLRKKF